MNITINERAEMKYMGYQYKAWFLNPLGVPFHKYFRTADEMDKFITKASEVGTTLRGFISR